MNSNYSMPMNLGNPDEYTIEQFALKIKDLVGKNHSNDIYFNKIFISSIGSESLLEYKDAVVDDPKQRRPDITLAKTWLNWSPKVNPVFPI